MGRGRLGWSCYCRIVFDMAALSIAARAHGPFWLGAVTPPRQLQFTRRPPSPAPNTLIHHTTLSTLPKNFSQWPSNRLLAYVQPLGAQDKLAQEANDMMQMLRRQVVLDLSVAMGTSTPFRNPWKHLGALRTLYSLMGCMGELR
jgi:hypothetical protein